MKFKKAMAFALTGALTVGAVCSGAFAESTTTVKLTVAEKFDTDYVLTIPTEVNVAGAGFTALEGGIKVSHDSEKTTEFDPNSKVTVSASSTNSWQLKADGVAEGIGYQLKGTAEDNAATTSWEFTGDKITNDGETKAVGVDVENYDDAAPGDYTDTITFTAKVESSAVAVTGITLNKTETSIQVGNNETLSVTAVTPDDATDKTYTWSSDKESVATVDADGKVTAVATGTANITATANDGSGVTATCAVTVTALAGVFVNGATLTMNNFKWSNSKGQALTITYNGTEFSATPSGSRASNMTKNTVTVNGKKITVQCGNGAAFITWVFDTATDHYTYTPSNDRGEFSDAGSFLLNGTDITSQLTKD